MAGATVPLANDAGYIMRVPYTDNTLYQTGTCIGQKISYDATVDKFSSSSTSVKVDYKKDNFKVEHKSDVVFSAETMIATFMTMTHANLQRLDCASQSLVPPPELVYDVPFQTMPQSFLFDANLAATVCPALVPTGYDLFILSPTTSPIA